MKQVQLDPELQLLFLFPFFQIMCQKELVPCLGEETCLEKYVALLESIPKDYRSSTFFQLFSLENEILKRTKEALHPPSFLAQTQAFLNATVSSFSVEGFDGLANLLFLSEDVASLELLAARAKKIDEQSPISLVVIGNSFSLNGDSQTALDMFNGALAVDPSYSMAWTLSGHELVQTKRLDEAIDRYRCALGRKMSYLP